MIKIPSSYSQYHQDLFNKLDLPFKKSKYILDIGCGDGIDSSIFLQVYGLKTVASDIFRHPNFNHIKIPFTKASIFRLPFRNQSFDYVFLHDVLHHVDEKYQRLSRHRSALKEAFRLVKNNGYLIIVEGNRFNPLFYFHMVKICGHNHFSQSYFKRLILSLPGMVNFKFIEAHLYPHRFLLAFKIYEYVMEHFISEKFRAYNIALIKKNRFK